jgi:hypothetical protein
MPVQRIHLISGPRNISTALMYSFAQRPDTAVVDEPFYAMYLAKTNLDHPGKSEVLASQSSFEDEVVNELMSFHEKPVLFIKNMAHHIAYTNEKYLSQCVNVFLIRNPRQIISSYAQVIEKPTLADIGIAYQYSLFEKLRASGNEPIVVDSELLLQDPVDVLRKICDKAGLQFYEEMLRWEPGPKPYDGVWATHWYANVHKSSGFEKQPTSDRVLPDSLQNIYTQALVYYEKLLPFSIKP